MSKLPTEERAEMVMEFSDMFKLAHGFRPRHIDWENLTDDELVGYYNDFGNQIEENDKADEAREAAGIKGFEETVADVKGYCSCDRETAIKYLMDAENDGGYFDVGYFEYLNDLPYGYIEGNEGRIYA